MDIIKRLKENEKPFGLMDEDMQAKAEDLGKSEFEIYNSQPGWTLLTGAIMTFTKTNTYRLRPDYEEGAGVVECEVIDGCSQLHEGLKCFHTPDGHFERLLCEAVNCPDFIGFKYKGGQVELLPRLFSNGSSTKSICQFRDLKGLTVLTPTHVLFREAK